MDAQIEDWLSSERYANGRAKLAAEFAQLNDAMVSSEPKSRFDVARRLSSLARSELSWFLLPVREYFLAPSTQQLIADSLRIETDVKTRDRTLNTLRHASERFIEHPMWEPTRSAPEEDTWRDWMHGIAESFVADPRSSTRAEVAYLLAACDDASAWDLFSEAVRRRPALLTTLHDAVLRYPVSMTTEIRAAMLALSAATAARNPRQQYAADGIRAALESDDVDPGVGSLA